MKPKKDILFGVDARNKLLAGMEIVYKAVSSTLGPRSNNVAINNPFTTPEILHDGVRVARSINLKDPFMDIGAELIRSSAEKTVDKVGDGTTTTTVLTYAIVKEAMTMIASGVKPMELKEQLDKASRSVTEQILALTKKIDKKEEIQDVARISAASQEIADVLGEVIDKVGKDAPITTEIGKKNTTYVEYMKGFEFDRGYLNQQFITDAKHSEAVIEDPYILITDKNISYQMDIVPFLQKFLKESGSKNLVIISGNLSDEALAIVTVNHLRMHMNVLPIQAPAWAERRIAELEDIAVFTGGTLILESSGRTLDSVDMKELGRAKRIVSDVDKTTIIEGGGDKDAITKKIEDLQAQIENAKVPYDREIKIQRLSKITGRAAIIYVGGATDTEVKEKRERVIDAIHATKAALQEGVVAGGAITLLHISRMSFWEKEDTVGSRLLRKALRMPFQILIENSGLDFLDAWEKISKQEYPFGIDVIDGEMKNLLETGVIDPVKVVRLTLENAVSIAGMAITTNVLISEVEEVKS